MEIIMNTEQNHSQQPISSTITNIETIIQGTTTAVC